MNTKARQGALLAVLAIAMVLVISLFSKVSSSPDDPGSTSNGKAGTLALYTWLHQLGFDTKRVEGGFDLHSTDTLFLIAPTTFITRSDVSKISDFISGGGNVILADSTGIDTTLLEKFKIDSGDEVSDGDAVPAFPLNSADDVHRVPVSNASGLSGANAVPVLSRDDGNVAVVAQSGKGRLYVVSSALPFSNDGLRQKDSAPFVLALLEHSRGGRIGFDEFHHGDTGSSENPLLGQGMDAVFTGPLGLASLLGLLLVVFTLTVNGRRLGGTVPREDPAKVPSAVDRVRAMTQLYARAGDRGGVAADYVAELKTTIGTVNGVSAALDDKDFVAALTGGPVDETRQIIERGRQLSTAKPAGRELAAYAKRVVELEDVWLNPPAR
jgi:hypothetical protein